MSHVAPIYPCPKCGAVGDVRHIRAATREQVERYVEAVRRSEGVPDLGYLWQLRAGFDHGEHLSAECPRCRARWREPILAGQPDIGTPIFDSLIGAT